MKILDHDGTSLVSDFWVEPFKGDTSVVLGSAGGKAARDYVRALQLLLERLVAVDARLVDAFVDSKQTRDKGLTDDDTRLQLRDGRTYPLHLGSETDLVDLRHAIGAAQEPIGQEGTVTGGNRNRRIRLVIEPSTTPLPTDLEGFLSAGTVTPPEIEDALTASAVAAGKPSSRQGFLQSAPARRAIELRAMEVARTTLEELGCSDLEDVSLKESYDLRCLLEGIELHVEVKGTTSQGERVLLTRNEVAHAAEWYPNVALIVVSGIKLRTVNGSPTAYEGQAHTFRPWKALAESLQPISYEYVVPFVACTPPRADLAGTEGLAG